MNTFFLSSLFHSLHTPALPFVVLGCSFLSVVLSVPSVQAVRSQRLVPPSHVCSSKVPTVSPPLTHLPSPRQLVLGALALDGLMHPLKLSRFLPRLFVLLSFFLASAAGARFRFLTWCSIHCFFAIVQIIRKKKLWTEGASTSGRPVSQRYVHAHTWPLFSFSPSPLCSLMILVTF